MSNEEFAHLSPEEKTQHIANELLLTFDGMLNDGDPAKKTIVICATSEEGGETFLNGSYSECARLVLNAFTNSAISDHGLSPKEAMKFVQSLFERYFK